MTERTARARMASKTSPVASKTAAPASPPPTRGTEAKNRIIAVAEALFTKQGFDGTSMRDIAAAAKMQAASMYYHFPSKEELLWAVWEKGGLEQLRRAEGAIAGLTDPWERMEAACVAHVTGLLDWRRANQVLFVTPPWQYPESIRDRVIKLRDEYEQIFIALIAKLPVRRGTDRHLFRLTLIGALSWPLFWFKAGGDAPEAIARRMLEMIRRGVEA
jgi:AcrR family transcriptional regulator